MFPRYLILVIFMVALSVSCTESTGPETQETSTVSGTVIRDDNLTAVPNVVVYDVAGTHIDTTSSNGTFSLTYDLTTAYNSSLVATRAGFGNDTINISLTPGADTSVTMVITADSTSPSTGTYSGKGASIYLVSSSEQTISIRGTGGNETTTMVFEVRDSLGIPVSATNPVNVDFFLDGGPGDGEYIFPASAVTDPDRKSVV